MTKCSAAYGILCEVETHLDLKSLIAVTAVAAGRHYVKSNSSSYLWLMNLKSGCSGSLKLWVVTAFATVPQKYSWQLHLRIFIV